VRKISLAPTMQIRLFVKLKLTDCARAEPVPGIFNARATKPKCAGHIAERGPTLPPSAKLPPTATSSLFPCLTERVHPTHLPGCFFPAINRPPCFALWAPSLTTTRRPPRLGSASRAWRSASGNVAWPSEAMIA
jgi:hypothetical protein